jgi:peptidyl-prolyl cis-trans isomerase SurA
MRPLHRAFLLLAALAAGSLACPRPVAAQENRIVAVVNGDIVTRGDVEGRRRLFALNAGLGGSQQVLDRLTPQVIRLLIDERLRLQEAQRRRVPVTDQEIAQAISDIERRNNLPPGGLVAQLRRAGVEPRVLFDQLRVQIAWSRLIRAFISGQSAPSDAEVADYIAAARARAGQQEFLVSEIFVPVDEPGEEPEVRRFAEEVVTQLRGGVAFPVAATQFSQSQTALAGGDLGWVGAEALDPGVMRLVTQMPPGAIAGPIRVPGGFQIVALRQRREVGRDEATMMTMRQVFFPFSSPLNPEAPTAQQVAQVERARGLAGTARSCEAMEAAARTSGSDRQVDPGPIRLESMQPPPLRAMLAGLPPGRASQPVIAPDGVVVLMVCSRETRNQAEITPEVARQQMARDRAELVSRQLQRDVKRRAQIEMRS